MNSIVITFQRFLKNKNTVTIIGVVAVIGILYWGYNTQISNAVTPVRNIPVAVSTIQPRTKITKDMIEYIDVAPIVLSDNAIRLSSLVIGKYTNINTVVPAGSMFYKETLIAENELPDASFTQVKKGEVVYNFPVTMDSTYGNSVFPGNKIDIYMKATTDAGQVMVGKLVENIKVLAVKDKDGRHVFENTEEARIPATLIFGVNSEINILLRKASYMKDFDVELFPVPHGGSIGNDNGNTQVSTQYLKEFINANTVVINTEDESKDATKPTPTPTDNGQGA